MARPMETQMTISCLQCEWSVEAVNTSSRNHLRSLRLLTPTRTNMSSTHLRSCND